MIDQLKCVKLMFKNTENYYLAKRAVDTEIWQWTSEFRKVLLLLLLLLLLLTLHHEAFEAVTALATLDSIDHVISWAGRAATSAGRNVVGQRGNALGKSVADRGRCKK